MTQRNRKVTIVVLAKYPDIFYGFRQSIDIYAPRFRRILVRDGSLIPDQDGWENVQGCQDFSMAGNANIGLRAAFPDDVFYCGDDVRLTMPLTIETLCALAHLDPRIGILSPQVVGGVSNNLQRAGDQAESVICSEERLAFVSVYIKRELLDCIGFLDERFSEYGYDDEDFCMRTKLAGYKLAVTPRIRINHGVGTDRSSTFRRSNSEDAIKVQHERSRLLFFEKWRSLFPQPEE